MRIILFILSISLSFSAFAAEVLHFNCLGKYQSLVRPVDAIELFPETPNGPKISLPEAAEYFGNIPALCGDELPSNGMLHVVTVSGHLYLIDLVFKNSRPVLVKHFSSKTVSQLEAGYKRTGGAGNVFLMNIDHPVLLNYSIHSESGLSVERLSYRSKLAAQYE